MFIEFAIDFNGSLHLLQNKLENSLKTGYLKKFGVKSTSILLALAKLFAKPTDESVSNAN